MLFSHPLFSWNQIHIGVSKKHDAEMVGVLLVSVESRKKGQKRCTHIIAGMQILKQLAPKVTLIFKFQPSLHGLSNSDCEKGRKVEQRGDQAYLVADVTQIS